MKLFLGAWALVSVAFVLGWGARSAMVADRDPHDARRAPSRTGALAPPGLFTRLAGRLALGGIVLAALGGLAVNGSLPRSVQNVVSVAAERVGLEIPSGDEKDNPRFASASASSAPLVRQRVLAVIDNWEGERGCEYLQALAHAAGGPLPACPRGSDGKRQIGPRIASSDGVIPPSGGKPHPALPTAEPSAAKPTPTETPSPTPTPTETPPADPPPDESPLGDPPPDEPPPEEPPP
jgi:hypothetical protein